jgi:hypothetical protein
MLQVAGCKVHGTGYLLSQVDRKREIGIWNLESGIWNLSELNKFQ